MNPSTETARVLIVDDDPLARETLDALLRREGYQLLFAASGSDVLQRMNDLAPDLILMDVMMPEMDGLETTKRIRGQLGIKDTPIIALTALAMAGDRERCLAAGMNDYLSKPVKLKELLTVIEQYLNKEGSS